MLESNEIVGLYNKKYFETHYGCSPKAKFYTDEEYTLESYHMAEIRSYRKYARNGNLLDIGSAAGGFLKVASKEGYNAYGLEISKEMAELAVKQGLSIFNGNLLQAGYGDNFFSVIRMGDVLEHIPNPIETLNEVCRIISKDGLLIIRIPAVMNDLLRQAAISTVGFLERFGIFIRKPLSNLPPYHLYEYTPRTIKLLLERTGFKVIMLKIERTNPSRLFETKNFLEGNTILIKVLMVMLRYITHLVNYLSGKADRLLVYAQRETND